VENRNADRQRRHPARGVRIHLGQPTIVFLTVCAKDRVPWLAQAPVRDALVDVWQRADAWQVGFYLLMPDHLHLFCAPVRLSVSLEQWVGYWKRQFSRLHLPHTGGWQRDGWDTRLRRDESYAQKWEYVRHNPVRKNLVARSEDWPFQGCLGDLKW